MKVFCAMLGHESNSFSPLPTSIQNYEEMLLFRPSKDTKGPVFEFMTNIVPLAHEAKALGYDVIEGLHASAQPSGPTVKRAYESLRDELLADLEAALPVNGVLMFLHGAQMAEGYDDCEGDLLTRIRAMVGPDVFIGVLLDLHGNITDAMIRNADALVPCKEYPHVDSAEQTKELVRIADDAMNGRISPHSLFEPIPTLGFYHTTREPMRSLVDELTAEEGHNGILAANFMHGFPLSDEPSTGAGVLLVVDDGDDEEHRARARTHADKFFAMRKEIDAKHPDMDTALDEIQVQLRVGVSGPIVLADTSDNPGGGAPGDSTFIIKALLDRQIKNAAVGALWDPEAVKTAFRAGEGAKLRMRIGGKTGALSGQPLDLDVTIKALDNNLTQETFAGQRDSFGPSALIEANGVEIILITLRQQVFGPDCFTGLGVDPSARQLLVVKSAQHFHAQFSHIAASIRYCTAPGYTDSDFTRLPIERMTRPIWPLDQTPFEAHGRRWQ